MRVLAYLFVILASTALSLGAALLIGLQFHDAPNGLLIATAFTSPFLVMGPLVIGALAAYWDHRTSPESRRYLAWWFTGVVVVDVVAAVLIVLAAFSAGAPAWVPGLLIVGTAVLLAVARPLGGLFRRTERPIADDPDRSLPDARAIRGKVRAIGTTFVIAAVLATLGAALLASVGGERGSDLLQSVLIAGQLTFTATAMATIFVTLPLNTALRDAGGRDIGRLRRFAKVVLRGKPIPLDDAEERGAVQYARIVPVTQQFQLAYIGLLYIGIAFQFVSAAIRGEFGVLPDFFLAAQVVVLVIVVPLTARRIQRARTYAEQHGGSAGIAPGVAAPLR